MVPTIRATTSAEACAFPAHGTRTGKPAVTRHDGRPHVTPIWFGVGGGELVFTTWHTSMEARAPKREGGAAVAVHGQEPPCSFVTVGGTLELVAETEDLIGFAARLGGCCMGRERADEFRRNGAPWELLAGCTRNGSPPRPGSRRSRR